MFASEPIVAAGLEEVDPGPGVFLVHLRGGRPYLGRTALLRRRLKRLARFPSDRIEYWPSASRLESSLVLYEKARTLYPESYLEFLKLRLPPWVKLVTSNAFPRTQITTKPSGGPCFGPFRTRASAELFERQMLDLFQLRRCQEDLEPAPDHPGCIYGEMGMCLRPCQELVGQAEYASETGRVAEFLRTGGKFALRAAEASRDQLSAEMEFEAAARQHKRAERIAEVLRARDELARDLDHLNGVAVTPAREAETVVLWFMLGGVWVAPVRLAVGSAGQSVSLDHRLREVVGQLRRPEGCDRAEHVALLARWFYSSWRDGAWIEFDTPERVPYKRLVNAVSKAVHESGPAASH